MRLLCLHGYASNGTTFIKTKTKALLAPTNNNAAPFTLEGLDGSASIDKAKPQQRAWFLFDPPYPLSDRTQQPAWRAHERVDYVAAEEALDSLVEAWRESDCDGVLGFSQGALMAAMLVTRLELLGCAPLPRVAILCHGFRTPLPSNESLAWWRDLPAGGLRTPALCLKGALDPVDTGGQAALLASLFATSRVHEIVGGAHAMPKEGADVLAVHSFVRSMATASSAAAPADDSVSDGSGSDGNGADDATKIVGTAEVEVAPPTHHRARGDRDNAAATPIDDDEPLEAAWARLQSSATAQKLDVQYAQHRVTGVGAADDAALCCVCGLESKQRCGRCRARRYCSASCQRSDWTGGHKRACAAAPAAPPAALTAAGADKG
jgi:predicted esterase